MAVFQSLPKYEVRKPSVEIQAIDTLIRSDNTLSRAGFYIVFQPGRSSPYVFRTRNIIEAQSIYVLADFWLDPDKFGRRRHSIWRLARPLRIQRPSLCAKATKAASVGDLPHQRGRIALAGDLDYQYFKRLPYEEEAVVLRWNSSARQGGRQ